MGDDDFWKWFVVCGCLLLIGTMAAKINETLIEIHKTLENIDKSADRVADQLEKIHKSQEFKDRFAR